MDLGSHCTLKSILLHSTMITIITSLYSSIVIEKMDIMWGYCDTLKFKNEVPEMCCANGPVKLLKLHSPLDRYHCCYKVTQAYQNISSLTYKKTINVSKWHLLKWQIFYEKIICQNSKGMCKFYPRAGFLLPLWNADNKFLQIYFIGNTKNEIDLRYKFNMITKREIFIAFFCYIINESVIYIIFLLLILC